MALFKKFWHGLMQPSAATTTTQSTITVVSGLPRSGTSLMMRMLAAGGIPPLTDHQRTADDDNPGGYYEFERVKQLEKGDTAWLATASGQAIKVISMLLRHLPADYHYQVIFMERDLDEILASQRKMLVNRDEDPDAVDATQMRALFGQHLQEINQWLAAQSNFELLYINHRTLLTEPEPAISRVEHFLSQPIDSAAMAAVIDPTLYRNRQGE